MAGAADLTAVVAACTMDAPEGSPGHALHSRRSARTLIGTSAPVTAAQIDQIWRLPRAAYAHRFGRA
jgi:hypothetical protein